ncbi:ethyl tert-butyl ether degradation protein EthD [Paraburkholderia podalyriae]|uniref:Ethyl tert-butyl ether degradation protein EthD n=1 Tax=Paraburkholderia podalyriae TaxID=1938811 RepID=A0ABR7PQ07_9BURK|nr:ethyl tert-butyl ether degradation protein EthD [Paraburkholderia podalyriae]MBC8748379.1 ethyl tert-butyl ether degradation protein EthD [Paraburkholderia podalyriae]
MQVCLFLTATCGTCDMRQPLTDTPALLRAATQVAGLRKLIVHEPIAGEVDACLAPAADAPSCVLQWYFDELAPLETALEPDGTIVQALQSTMRAELKAQTFSQQLMAVRTFAPPHAASVEPSAQRCTYLVAYEGVAQDFNAWLTHYLAHHPPLMLQLPALRELEIYTRIDSRSGLPFAHASAMQRNKVVFDDATALTDALGSPVRDAMRRDFHALPAYSGATPHFAMRSIYGNLAAC